MKPYLLLSLIILVNLATLAQTGKLTGKVLNEKNEPLAGVTVKIVGASGGTSTNVEGYYNLVLSSSRKYELEFSALGYEKKRVDEIEVQSGKVTELNIALVFSKSSLSTVTVTANKSNARRETAASMLSFQKNTSTVASVISAESIRRSPDKNTGEVLKRTPGASIQEGKFIVVRGLADRYNQAMLNGILLTSTEPDRKSFSFDLIPSSMIDNIVINKAFLPEFPGEWAGGLIQVNTKDIPASNFMNIQLGTGFNAQTIGKDFLQDQGGKLDFLGLDDGTRKLPSSYVRKSQFDALSHAEKTDIGRQLRNAWEPVSTTAPVNTSFQFNGGFNSKVFGKTLGASIGITYNRSNRFLDLQNTSYTLANQVFSKNYDYGDDRFAKDVLLGALGSISLQLNSKNRISYKTLANLNTSNYVTSRTGFDYNRDESMKGTEFAFKQHIFYTNQLIGEHSFSKNIKFKWNGAFSILDGTIPDQRRVLYSKSATIPNDPYKLVISNSLSQQSGSRIYQDLSDYIYTAGGDLSWNFDLFKFRQTLKGGYFFQVKDRLYDAKLFAIYMPLDNPALRLLPASQAFVPENFGDGAGKLFGFDAIKSSNFRYLANTILNAGYLQMDNQFSDAFRLVWGLRIENYDQLVGSVKTWDPRHTHSVVTDLLPGFNATFKLNNLQNLRISGSQTVIRPELRELSFLNIYDFELNASVQGNPSLKRTKITNMDIRYEYYPKAGEVFTAGVFYKNFVNPIEQIFNEGAGGASTFSYQNPDQARTYGLELEMRKKLDFVSVLKNFTIQANASYINSRIKDDNLKVDRPLQGQSPYLLNAGLMYDHTKSGLSMTLLFNRIGERIYLVGDLTAGAGSPDIYEAPRSIVDFQLTKKLLEGKAELRMNISDILNQTQYFYQNADNNYKFQKGKDAYRFTRRFGSTIGLTFNYTLK